MQDIKEFQKSPKLSQRKEEWRQGRRHEWARVGSSPV